MGFESFSAGSENTNKHEKILAESYKDVELRYPTLTPEDHQYARFVDRLGRLIHESDIDLKNLSEETGIEIDKLEEIGTYRNDAWPDKTKANLPINDEELDKLTSALGVTVGQLEA